MSRSTTSCYPASRNDSATTEKADAPIQDAWWVYIAACRDGSWYTGVARDVERRIADHNAGRGARYTNGRRPVRLVDRAGPMEHGQALRLERRIKRVARPRKLSELRRGPPSVQGRKRASSRKK